MQMHPLTVFFLQSHAAGTLWISYWNRSGGRWGGGSLIALKNEVITGKQVSRTDDFLISSYQYLSLFSLALEDAWIYSFLKELEYFRDDLVCTQREWILLHKISVVLIQARYILELSHTLFSGLLWNLTYSPPHFKTWFINLLINDMPLVSLAFAFYNSYFHLELAKINFLTLSIIHIFPPSTVAKSINQYRKFITSCQVMSI